MSLHIEIKTIPHHEQRYPTVGDYFINRQKGGIFINISDMNNWRFEAVVAVHELIEYILTKQAGISEKEIDDFDINFEKNRLPDDESEPGDNINAPYYEQHQIATGIEKILAVGLKIDWNEYEKTINSL